MALANAGCGADKMGPGGLNHSGSFDGAGATDAELRARYGLPAAPQLGEEPTPPADGATSTLSGVHLSTTQIAAAAYFRGKFTSPGDLDTAVRIALAESSGWTQARDWHPEEPALPDGGAQADRGLWQISSLYWPDYPDSCTDDPLCAASVAETVKEQSGGWSAWATYSSGAYERLSPAFGDVTGDVKAFLAGLP